MKALVKVLIVSLVILRKLTSYMSLSNICNIRYMLLTSSIIKKVIITIL